MLIVAVAVIAVIGIVALYSFTRARRETKLRQWVPPRRTSR